MRWAGKFEATAAPAPSVLHVDVKGEKRPLDESEDELSKRRREAEQEWDDLTRQLEERRREVEALKQRQLQLQQSRIPEKIAELRVSIATRTASIVEQQRLLEKDKEELAKLEMSILSDSDLERLLEFIVNFKQTWADNLEFIEGDSGMSYARYTKVTISLPKTIVDKVKNESKFAPYRDFITFQFPKFDSTKLYRAINQSDFDDDDNKVALPVVPPQIVEIMKRAHISMDWEGELYIYREGGSKDFSPSGKKLPPIGYAKAKEEALAK